jgi:hypothetical protein
VDLAMIAVARQLLSVSCEWAGDLRHAGHNQDPSDLGGHSPDGVQVHAPRVPKAPNRSESPTLEGMPPAERSKAHGASSLNLSEQD